MINADGCANSFPFFFAFISLKDRPEAELWRDLAAFAGERKTSWIRTLWVTEISCQVGVITWMRLKTQSHILCPLVCGSDCVSLSHIAWCVVSSPFHGKQSTLWFFDLFPNCLERSSLRDKVNLLSGAAETRTEGKNGRSRRGLREKGERMHVVLLWDKSPSRKQRLLEDKSSLYTKHVCCYGWTLSNGCYQTCHILFMSCGVPGWNKKSKAPNRNYGIKKIK